MSDSQQLKMQKTKNILTDFANLIDNSKKISQFIEKITNTQHTLKKTIEAEMKFDPPIKEIQNLMLPSLDFTLALLQSFVLKLDIDIKETKNLIFELNGVMSTMAKKLLTFEKEMKEKTKTWKNHNCFNADGQLYDSFKQECIFFSLLGKKIQMEVSEFLRFLSYCLLTFSRVFELGNLNNLGKNCKCKVGIGKKICDNNDYKGVKCFREFEMFCLKLEKAKEYYSKMSEEDFGFLPERFENIFEQSFQSDTKSKFTDKNRKSGKNFKTEEYDIIVPCAPLYQSNILKEINEVKETKEINIVNEYNSDQNSKNSNIKEFEKQIKQMSEYKIKDNSSNNKKIENNTINIKTNTINSNKNDYFTSSLISHNNRSNHQNSNNQSDIKSIPFSNRKSILKQSNNSYSNIISPKRNNGNSISKITKLNNHLNQVNSLITEGYEKLIDSKKPQFKDSTNIFSKQQHEALQTIPSENEPLSTSKIKKLKKNEFKHPEKDSISYNNKNIFKEIEKTQQVFN